VAKPRGTVIIKIKYSYEGIFGNHGEGHHE
jgi:hypothetical protein